MNSAAEVELKWADGTYLFALKLKQLEELQRVCGSPFAVLAKRVLIDEWDARDVVHTIRLGLIGGGMPPVRASELVDMYLANGGSYADPDDPANALLTAKAVLGAVYFGFREMGEPGDPKTMAAAPQKRSTSRPSGRSSSSSGSARKRSTK